jgi:hypothetical protein
MADIHYNKQQLVHKPQSTSEHGTYKEKNYHGKFSRN